MHIGYMPIFLGLIVGMDNLRVGVCLGGLEFMRERKVKLAVAFACMETVMPLLGLLIGNSIRAWIVSWGDYLGAIVLAGCGIYTLYHYARKSTVPVKVLESTWLLWGLPLVLSFDNLLIGVGLGLKGQDVMSQPSQSAASVEQCPMLVFNLGLLLPNFCPRDQN